MNNEIEKYQGEIISEVENLYNFKDSAEETSQPNDEEEKEKKCDSIIFQIGDEYFLSIKSEKTYFINENDFLYKNLLFKIKVNNKLRNLTPSMAVYISDFNFPKLNKRVDGVDIAIYEATGEIYEIEKKEIIFENFNIVSSFFTDKKYTTEEAYSLLLSESFIEEFERVTKLEVKHINLEEKSYN